jgi:hypothetical protein
MVIECTEKSNEEQIKAFLQGVGAAGINIQVAETGWWLGRYDKDKTPFEHKGATLA